MSVLLIDNTDSRDVKYGKAKDVIAHCIIFNIGHSVPEQTEQIGGRDEEERMRLRW